MRILDETGETGKVFAEGDFIYLTNNARCWVVRVSEILGLEAQGNYTRIWLADGSALIRASLGFCAGRLDPGIFFQIRRDWVVNLGAVREVRRVDAKRFGFVLSNGKELEISRARSLALKRQMGFG